MAKKRSKLKKAQKKAKAAVKKTNKKIDELGNQANELYISLNRIHSLFACIRNVPKENMLEYKRLKNISVDWKQQAEKIEAEYQKAKMKVVGEGAIGAGIAALSPAAAMGVATTFGVASTGTAVSALSGAAAIDTALAWLGGGAVAAGGGGVAVGSAFLALVGPVGWTVAGVFIIASGWKLYKMKRDQERLENVYALISKRDIKSYELAIVELSERMKRIKDETEKLDEAFAKIETFGKDYDKMSEVQQYELGSYVNLMEASTMLLVNPILGLQPKYSEQDFEKLCASENDKNRKYFMDHKNMVISMANLLYKIKLHDRDKKLLVKSLRKNKKCMSLIQMSPKKFDVDDITMVEKALRYKYKFGA